MNKRISRPVATFEVRVCLLEQMLKRLAMKTWFFSLLLFPALSVFSQNYAAHIAEAEGFYQQKKYPESAAAYRKAFKLEQKNPSDLYNAGCSAALAGDKKQAFKWLRLAFKNGWINIHHMKSDADLNSLHSSRQWNKLLADMQKKVDEAEANYDKPLQAELLAIFEEDQKYRKMMDEVDAKYGWESPEMRDLIKKMIEADSINLIKVKAILDKHGWVGPDKVGGRANQTLFLVIQHADLTAQQKYLPMMREAVRDKRANASSLALLEDRVALREGRRQLYGSQVGRDPDTGEMYVLPLEDPDHVDERRAQVGLPPLADYIRHWGMTWDVEAYKKQLPEIEAKQRGKF